MFYCVYIMLGELIQSLWNTLKGNTETKKSHDLQQIHDNSLHSVGLPQGEAYLGYRENKMARGQQHIAMLTDDMKSGD